MLSFRKAGIIVSLRAPSSSYKIDACSIWEPDERPYVLLSNDKTSSRSRFDIAHELGHLILHSKLKKSEFNKKEKLQANRKRGSSICERIFITCSPVSVAR
ncbi:ImmA/IrrE family metallo-endopeptidase [Paenibacillus larvae]|uniref:ImmA/IrrE family metallo-endopeptidase n=1 Tax=Paenibacillus larvae TaxID=1464 RepID=UPI0037C82512